jgi:hypothetical protein
MTWTHRARSQCVTAGTSLYTAIPAPSRISQPAPQFVHSAHRRHSRAHQTRFDALPKPPLSVVGSIDEPRPQQDSRSRSRGALWWPLLRLTAIDNAASDWALRVPSSPEEKQLRLEAIDGHCGLVGGRMGDGRLAPEANKYTMSLHCADMSLHRQAPHTRCKTESCF